MRGLWKWTKRGTLGLLLLVIVVVGGALAVIHTDWGRDQVRAQVQAKLDDVFVGGATIGRLEGSPFSELIARDVVINDPQGAPAIKVGVLTISIGLRGLIEKRAKLSVIAEDVDVLVERDEHGALKLEGLLRPGPKSGWSVELTELVVRRGHVALDLGTERMNLDELEISAAADLPFGGPIDARVKLAGRWRERAAPIAVSAALHSDEEMTSVSRADVRAGDVVVTAEGVRIAAGGRSIAGAISVEAPRAAVARLLPGVDLPVDVGVRVEAKPGESGATRVRIDGRLGGAPVTAMLTADLEGRRVAGFVAAGELDAAKLSRGKIEGMATALVSFRAALPAGGGLPAGEAMIHAWGDVAGVPGLAARIAVTSTGERATALVDLTGRAVRANAAADVEIRGGAIALHRGRLIASTADPRRASGGRAPLSGAIRVDLTARGAVSPEPSLAVSGTVAGERLRFQDVSVASMKVAIDASRLPARPLGRAELRATGVVRGTMELAELTVNAANRRNGKVFDVIDVSLRTRPKQHPWLLEADAVVTPGRVITVDLVKHHVRTGTGGAPPIDWYGNTGRVAISDTRIDVRNFATKSARGGLDVSGVYHRAGRRTGDAEARLAVTGFDLAAVNPRYRGKVAVRGDVARRRGRITGTIGVTGAGVALDPAAAPVEVDAEIVAREGPLALAAGIRGDGLGSARVELDIDAPRNLADVAAWQRLERGAIQKGRVKLEAIDLARLVATAFPPGKPRPPALDGEIRGKIDGELALSPTAITGRVRLAGAVSPLTADLGAIRADLELAAAQPGEVTPALTAHIERIGDVAVNAVLAMPQQILDPAAWQALGRGALKSATIRADRIALDPGVLERFGVRAELRGQIAVNAEIAEAARTASLTVQVRQFRAPMLAQAVDLTLTANIDEDATTAKLIASTAPPVIKPGQAAVQAKPQPVVQLLQVDAKIPLSIAAITANPRAAPLEATATLPNVPAKQLVAVLGRSDVLNGTLAGTVEVGGTLGAPTGRAKLEVRGLGLAQGARRRSKPLERLTLDATWDGTTGAVTIDGAQPGGSLRVVARGNPKQLKAATVSVDAKAFDLGPVLALLPGAAGGASGQLDARLAVTGLDPATAKLAGELHLAEARVPIAPSIGTLRRAKVDIVIGERQLRVAVDGRLGSGTVKANGTVAMIGATPTGGNLTITLREVSMIGEIEPRVNADITAKLGKEQDRWVADVAVRNGLVKIPSERGKPLKPIGLPPDMTLIVQGAPAEEEEPSVFAMVARVTIYATHIESAELRGIIKGKLTITAEPNDVTIIGSIDADRGDFDLFGRRYVVERAGVRFDGPPDPRLDIRIAHDFPEVTTVTEVRGRLSKPELIMSSDPGIYSQGQLLGFLLGGEPNGQSNSGNPRDQVTAAGTSLVANQIGGYVKKALPVDLDVLRYEAATASTSAAITVGTWLTRSLFVAYRRRIEARPDENSSEAEIEYWLSRRIMLEGILGDRGRSGLDLLWRKRY